MPCMEMNGIAHIQLSVRDMERSRRFYKPLFEFLQMRVLIDAPIYFYAIGSRTGVALSPAEEPEEFHQRRVGLHHFCFRARQREDVDATFAFMKDLDGATVVREPRDDSWAPGYYSMLVEDPDGIRIEVNHVPGKGHLKDKTPQ